MRQSSCSKKWSKKRLAALLVGEMFRTSSKRRFCWRSRIIIRRLRWVSSWYVRMEASVRSRPLPHSPEIKPKFTHDYRQMLYKIHQYTNKLCVDDYMGVSIDFISPKGRNKKHRCFLHSPNKALPNRTPPHSSPDIWKQIIEDISLLNYEKLYEATIFDESVFQQKINVPLSTHLQQYLKKRKFCQTCKQIIQATYHNLKQNADSFKEILQLE